MISISLPTAIVMATGAIVICCSHVIEREANRQRRARNVGIGILVLAGFLLLIDSLL
jgi:hypothetical protein